MSQKLRIKIWSDVTCVHCYIAKRKFEQAFAHFEHTDSVEIIWKSFELAPGLRVDRTKSMYQFLADYNRASLDQVKMICDQIKENAKVVGLHYDFEIARPANSLLAHRFSHIAKHENLQDKAKEAMFRAHFTEGKDIDDISTLMQIAVEVGLDKPGLKEILEGKQFAEEVTQDILEAKLLNINGVPLYLFNESIRVSGVQDSQVYLQTLERAFAEWQDDNLKQKLQRDRNSCEIGKDCMQ